MTALRPLLDERIALKHGAGGRAMRALIESVFLEGFVVVTTDSHVIQPPFFPGGDIGRLSISGTVNDLSMMGATEVLGLTCAVILEAGFQRAALVRVQRSMREACIEAGAPVVTGRTPSSGTTGCARAIGSS
jgi:hydrogenase expression/formation protein HypE